MNSIVVTADGIGEAGASSPEAGLDIHDHSDVKDYETVGEPFVEDPKMSARNVNVYYADKQAIMDVSLDIGKNEVIAMIGPSGCGKSTFLRTLNRMNDIIPICRVEGNINLEDQDIYRGDQDTVLLRARVGMVFQKPNPFPKSIYENVAYGPRIHGLAHSKAELDEIVEKSLRRACLQHIAVLRWFCAKPLYEMNAIVNPDTQKERHDDDVGEIEGNVHQNGGCSSVDDREKEG